MEGSNRTGGVDESGIMLSNGCVARSVAVDFFVPWGLGELWECATKALDRLGEPPGLTEVIPAQAKQEREMPGTFEHSAVGRRSFLQMAAATGFSSAAVASVAKAGPSETDANTLIQPSPDFGAELNTSDIIVETLIAWGATHAFGIVGDGINSIIEALRKREDRIRYVGVRHEERQHSWRPASPSIRAGLASASGPRAPALFT
jgi:hypothetical protein